jgi:hypothetical protein
MHTRSSPSNIVSNLSESSHSRNECAIFNWPGLDAVIRTYAEEENCEAISQFSDGAGVSL